MADTKRNGVKYAVSFCSMGNMEHDAAAFLYGVRSIGVFVSNDNRRCPGLAEFKGAVSLWLA